MKTNQNVARVFVSAAAVASLVTPQTLKADIFGDAVNAVTAPARAVVQAHVEAVNVVTGQHSPGQAVNNIGRNLGQGVQAGANVYGQVHNGAFNALGNVAGSVAGDGGRAFAVAVRSKAGA